MEEHWGGWQGQADRWANRQTPIIIDLSKNYILIMTEMSCRFRGIDVL